MVCVCERESVFVCCARACVGARSRLRAPRKEPRTQIVIPGYHNLNVTIKLSRSASYRLIHFITCPTWGKIKEERILLATNMYQVLSLISYLTVDPFIKLEEHAV
jgi:hypothetical protein